MHAIPHQHTPTYNFSCLCLVICCLVSSSRLVDLSGASRYEGAELDSCLLEERARGAVLPDDQDVDPTNDPSHWPVVAPTHLSALTPGALTVIKVFC